MTWEDMSILGWPRQYLVESVGGHSLELRNHE